MMDLNDANQSSQNTGDRNEGEKLEQEDSNNAREEIAKKVDSEDITDDKKLQQESALNNAREDISDKIDSESIADDEKAPSLRRQQNGYFEKETESYEIIENICQSFNDFQKTIVNFDKAAFSNDDFYDHTSMIEQSPTSCTSGNLLPNISEPRIIPTRASPTMEYSSSESTIIPKREKLPPISNAEFYKPEMHCDVFKEDDDWDINQPVFETSDNTESLQESRFSFERLKNENAVHFSKINSIRSVDYVSCQRKPINQPFNITETNERDVEEIKIISTGASTMESSTSVSTIIPKCKKLPPISNSGVYKREMHCDVFKEDDDWDIYTPGFVITRTESLQESRFSSQRFMTINAEYLAKNESKCSNDYIPCQRVLPYIEQGIRCSPSNNFHNDGRTFQESTEERMLQEVKEFFLNYPVDIIADLSDRERKMSIIISRYFSRDFAVRHGLPLPIISPILKLELPEDPAKIRKLFEGYELIQNLGVSEDGFFDYICIDNKRPVDRNHWLPCKSMELNPSTISELDCIQERVGTNIFNMIYEQLKTDANYQAIFRDEEFLACASLYWCTYADFLECGGQPTNIEDDEVYNIPDIVSEENELFSMNEDFPSTTSRSNVNKIPGVNYFELNSYADNEISDDIFVSRTNMDFQSTTSLSHALKIPALNDLDRNLCADVGKNSRYSTDLPKVQQVNPSDFLEIKLECSPTMQSTNQDNNENPSSIDLFQGHSDKSNQSPNPASFMRPRIQNSFHQNDETPRKVGLVTPYNTTHYSDQRKIHNSSFKGKSINDQPEKSFEVLENASKELPRVRKYISQGDDANSRKKICLQGNLNFGQPEPYKDELRRKDEARTPSQDSWPIKPRRKSCIIM